MEGEAWHDQPYKKLVAMLGAGLQPCGEERGMKQFHEAWCSYVHVDV